MERRTILISVLLLSLLSLTYSLFQVKQASPSPNLQIAREIFTPASNWINVTGQGLASINLKFTSFENPFINYTDVTAFAGDPDVLSTRFRREIGKSPYNIEYLYFRTVVNNTDNVVSVNYTFTLTQDYLVKDGTMLVLYVNTNINGTMVSLLGEDYDGNEVDVTFVLDEAYQQYYLFVKPVPNSFKIVRTVSVTHVCQPRGSFKAYTYFRILNIFDDRPSIDSEDLVQGQDWLQFKELTLPHRFSWEQLKALNTTINIKLTIHPDSNSTLNTLSYIWKIPDQLNVTVNRASLIFLVNSLIEAPIAQARIMVEENESINVIDVTSNVTEAFSSQPLNPRLDISIPNYGRSCIVVLSYLYWPLPWGVIAILSLVITIVDSIVILLYLKQERI